jgi:hypothetical protein
MQVGMTSPACCSLDGYLYITGRATGNSCILIGVYFKVERYLKKAMQLI